MDRKIQNKIANPVEHQKAEYKTLLAKKDELEKEISAGPRASDKDYTVYDSKEKELEMIKKMLETKKNVVGVEEGKARAKEIKEKIDEKKSDKAAEEEHEERMKRDLKETDEKSELEQNADEETRSGGGQITEEEWNKRQEEFEAKKSTGETNEKTRSGGGQITEGEWDERLEDIEAKKTANKSERTRSGGGQITEEEWNERAKDLEKKRNEPETNKLAEVEMQPEPVSVEKNEAPKPVERKELSPDEEKLKNMRLDLADLKKKYEEKKLANETSKSRIARVLGKAFIIDKASQEEESLRVTIREREKEIANLERAATVSTEYRFENRFGIKKEDLEKVPGFSDLSEGRKLLVLENLGQMTLGRIQEEAVDAYETDVKSSKFLGRIWKSMTKRFQVAKKEKMSSQEILKGGIETHGDILEQLVAMAKEGPEAKIGEGGKLEIQYAAGFENLTEEEQKKVDNFNQLATKFSKIPYEWSLETANNKQYREHLNLESEYKESLLEILKLKVKKGEDPLEANLSTNNIDRNVKMNQFLNVHPELEKQLQMIDDGRLWTKALKDTATERGGYFALGLAARTATVSLIGLAAAPVAAGFVGGIIGRERAKGALKEKERKSRKGVEDTGKEAKDFADAKNLYESMEFLIGELKKEPEGSEKRDEMTRSLTFQLTDAKNKIGDGTVNFGTKEERLVNQFQLIQNMCEAENILHGNDSLNRHRYNEDIKTIEEFLEKQETERQSAKSKLLWKETGKAVGISAGFAAAGWIARHLAGEFVEQVQNATDKATLAGLTLEPHGGPTGEIPGSAGVPENVPAPRVPSPETVPGNPPQAIPETEPAVPHEVPAEALPVTPEAPAPQGKVLTVEQWKNGKLKGSVDGIIKDDRIANNIDTGRRMSGTRAAQIRMEFEDRINELKDEGKIPKRFSLHRIQPGAQIELSADGEHIIGFKDGPGGKFTEHIRINDEGEAEIVSQEAPKGGAGIPEEGEGKPKPPSREPSTKGPDSDIVEKNINKNIDLKTNPEKFVQHFDSQIKNIADLNKQLEELSGDDEDIQNMGINEMRSTISTLDKDIASKGITAEKATELKGMKAAMEDLLSRRLKVGEATAKTYYGMAESLYGVKGLESLKSLNAKDYFEKNSGGDFQKMVGSIVKEGGVKESIVVPKGRENMLDWTKRVFAELLKAKGVNINSILRSS